MSRLHRNVVYSDECMPKLASRFIVCTLIVWAMSFGAVPEAGAHSAEGSPSSNYHTTIDSISPSPKGFAVRVVERGSRLEVRWLSGPPLIVEGYNDDPYLRIGPDGVSENRQSTAVYTNRTRDGTGAIPDVNSDGPPEWVNISAEPVARFHDHRIHYMGSVPPDKVLESPKKRQLVQEFEILIHRGEMGTETTKVVGRVEWIPSPSPMPALVAAGVVAVLIAAAAAWAGVRHDRRPLARRLTIIALTALVIVDVVHLIGIAGGVEGGSIIGRMISIGYASLAAWIVSLVAIVLLLRRNDDAMYLVTFAAALMTLVGGVADLGILSKSSVVFLWSPNVARFAVAATLGLGIGIVIAGVLLTRPVLGESNGQPTTATA